MHQASQSESTGRAATGHRPRAADRSVFPAWSPAVRAPLWLLFATSGFVMVEPAPFDLLAVALCAFYAATGLRLVTGLQIPMIFAALFLLANAVSIVFAPLAAAEKLPQMTFYAALTVYMFVLWLLLASLVAADPRRIVPVIWNGWTVAAVITALLGIAGYFRAIPGSEHLIAMGRAKATFKDPNVYGPFLVPVMIYCLASMRGGHAIANLIRFGIFILLLVGLLLGFSRGAWGNFVASLLVFGTLAVLNGRKLSDYMSLLWAGSSLVAISVAVLVFAISNPHVSEMFSKRASLLQSYDVQAGGRFSTQSAALKVIAEAPLGIGPNRTKPFLDRNPHNVYLKIFAENGWVGGTTFLAFLGITLWHGFFFCIRPGPLQRDAVIVYACTLGIVAESVIIDTLHWRHYFVLLGMLWGLMLAGRLRRNTTTKQATVS